MKKIADNLAMEAGQHSDTVDTIVDNNIVNIKNENEELLKIINFENIDFIIKDKSVALGIGERIKNEIFEDSNEVKKEMHDSCVNIGYEENNGNEKYLFKIENIKQKISKRIVNKYQKELTIKDEELDASGSNEQQQVQIEENVFSCDVCSETFSVQSNLIQHKLCHKIFACEICNKSFTRKSYLVEHKQTHSGDAYISSYPCDICNKTYSQLNSLVRHKRTHTDYKPYSCRSCDRTFNSNSGLIQHERIIHSGEKPYSCDLCDRTFRCRSYLMQHKQVHDGEKPFSCNICHKTFSHQNYLVQHKKSHTGKNH